LPARRRPWFVVLAAVVAVAIVAGIVALAVGSGDGGGGNAAAKPDTLMVDGAVNPVGVDPDGVAFAWHVRDARVGAFQRDYRILVSRDADPHPGSSAVVWDDSASSGRQAFVAYRGSKLAADTQYWWTVQTTTDRRANGSSAPLAPETSPFAASGTFVTGMRDADWKAQWIAPEPGRARSVDQYTYVRKDASVASSPIVRATAYVAAQHQYRLFVNGSHVASGPSYSYPDESYYEATDVTHAFRAGSDNAIGVLHFWSGAGQGRPAADPALLVQITVLHEDGSREVIGTDRTWREHAAEWLPGAPRNDEGGFTERVDGRRAPLGWDEPRFDAKDWAPVTVLGPAGTKPFTHLVAQRTHIVEHAVQPRSVRTLPSGAVVADYGAVIAARPAVAFGHGVDGRAVAMHVGYVLDPDGHVSSTVATQGTDLGFSYTERAGAQQFAAYTYLGFRYLEVDAPGEALDAGQLTAYARHAAVPDEDAAAFTSSVPTLDKVWQLLRHSALYVAQEQFVDTPTREKGQFLGDSFNDSLAAMHAFGDQNLTVQALRDFERSQARYHADGNLNDVYPNGDGARTTLDFTERYPEWVWQYYLQTGDIDTLRQLYPVLVRVAHYLYTRIDGHSGLVVSPSGAGVDLVDWPPAMRYGYDMDTVARTTANVLAAEDFRVVAKIGSLLGDADGAVEQRRHDRLVAAINAKLTRPDGVYVDGLGADGAQSPHAAQQGNAFALAFGIVPPARVAAVGKYVAGLGIKTGPMDGLYLLQGLQAAGIPDAVVRVLTDTKDPGWAHVVGAGGTFSWESWILSDAEGDGMSHGWGSSAIVAFQTALLGVTETESVAATGPVLEIDAPRAGPARVAGRVPTVAGAVDVEWRRSGDRLALHLTIPPNATARVRMTRDKVSVLGAGTYTLTNP
jgi:alpha-L-rhamnosidase